MSKNRYILSIDQGTTSSRAIIFDVNGQILAQKNLEFKQYYPKNGWVEHNANEILDTTISAIKHVITEAKINVADICTSGIANQRETVVAWDKSTGQPIHNAIVWQDRRTEDICEDLKGKNLIEEVQKKTGLIIDPYFSATKIKWIIENVNDANKIISNKNLLVGTIDSWLIWNFTKGDCHLTDATNASRTMLYNIQSDQWDSELLELLNIPHEILPEVKNSTDNFGVINKEFFGSEIPIEGVAGDQQAASFGQLCFDKGMIKSTYGTGCFMLMNTGDEMMISKSNLLSTTAYKTSLERKFALEGSIFNAGTVVQWMRDELNFFNDSSEVEELASKSKNSIYFVPAFTGLGAPYWRSEIRGSIHGITRDTTKADIALAALKSICFQTKDLFNCLIKDTGTETKDFVMRVDGGMSKNNFMMQYLSDILGVKIERPVNQESTATGAAYLAGLQSGLYKDIADLKELWKTDTVFEPNKPDDHLEDEYEGWTKTINSLINNG
jgi:glycerol kinase